MDTVFQNYVVRFFDLLFLRQVFATLPVIIQDQTLLAASMIDAKIPRNENPMNIPIVPPKLPTNDIVDITKYSFLTVL